MNYKEICRINLKKLRQRLVTKQRSLVAQLEKAFYNKATAKIVLSNDKWIKDAIKRLVLTKKAEAEDWM